MQCAYCNAPLDDNAVFCGTCGKQVVSRQTMGATMMSGDPGATVPASGNPVAGILPSQAGVDSPRFTNPKSIPPELYSTQRPIPEVPLRETPLPLTAPPRQPRRSNTRRLALIAIIIILVVAGGAIGLLSVLQQNKSASPPAASASGTVSFFDSQNSSPGYTDALKISISGLSAAPAGSQYDAWFINTQSEQITALGKLTGTAPTFSLSFDSNSVSKQQGTNLLAVGNKLEITLEQGTVSAPTGKVVLVGTFPPNAFSHIQHLLVSFPTTPGKIGLLVGLQQQAQLLNAQALALQNAATGQQTTGIHIQCAAQSIIDIIEGAQGTNYQPLGAECAALNINASGDGFGLSGTQGYLAESAAHVSLAANQSDTTDSIRVHARHVEVAITNIKGWVTTIDQDALALLADPSNGTRVAEVVKLSDRAYHGTDTNGDEQVDPVAGEAGAITAYTHGQLMASLTLVPGR